MTDSPLRSSSTRLSIVRYNSLSLLLSSVGTPTPALSPTATDVLTANSSKSNWYLASSSSSIIKEDEDAGLEAAHPPTYPPNLSSKLSFARVLLEGTPFKHSLLNGVYVVPGTAHANGSPAFRSKICSRSSQNRPITSIHRSLTSMYDYLQFGFNTHPHLKCISFKLTLALPFTSKTFAEVSRERDTFGSGLVHLIQKELQIPNHQLSGKDDFVLTLFLPNSYEWFVADLACISYSVTNTSLYQTTSDPHIATILSLTQSAIAVVTPLNIMRLLKLVAVNKITTLRILIVTGEGAPVIAREMARDLGITVYSFLAVLKLGASFAVAHIEPVPETVYTVSFTSGTAGMPKGVVLTHGNGVAALASIISAITPSNTGGAPGTTARSLCVLPLSHVYQRAICLYELVTGCNIFVPFDLTDLAQVMADLSECKPTHLVGVPRLFNKIEAGITRKIQSLGWVTRAMHKRTLDYKKDRFQKGEQMTNHWIYDKAFTRKIRQSLGLDSLRLLVTGSALILPETIIRVRSLLNTEFFQGYGLTESFASITIGFNEDEYAPLSAGYITISTEFRLKDRPEFGFLWGKNRSGELLLRGPQMSLLYYKDPKATRDSYDAEGWFLTGDIATLDSHNRLKIIDRAFNLVTLSLGLVVSPEFVENVYLQRFPLLVRQMYVYGASSHKHMVAILVIDEKECLEVLRTSGSRSLRGITYMDETNMNELNSNMDLRRFLLDYLNRNVRGISEHQRVRNFYFFFNNALSATYARNQMENTGFTVENDMLTPTLKLRRQALVAYFAVPLQRMLAELG